MAVQRRKKNIIPEASIAFCVESESYRIDQFSREATNGYSFFPHQTLSVHLSKIAPYAIKNSTFLDAATYES